MPETAKELSMTSGVYERQSPGDRLKDNVQVTSQGCWEWTAYRDKDGYGTMFLNGKPRRAHIASYLIFVGPIPDGAVLDHLCSNPSCVCPGHLQPVTVRENLARSRNHVAVKMKQTHCLRGHPLSGENLYMTPDGRRQCRACRNMCEKRRHDHP
jgi:hypothetical protein